MNLKSFVPSLAAMALFACGDSGTGTAAGDNTGSSSSVANSQGSVATDLSSNSDVENSSSSQSGNIWDVDYGTMTVSIEGKDFTVDTVTAVAPMDWGSDSSLAGMLNNTMLLTATQRNGELEESEMTIAVKDPKVGDNEPASFTSLYLVYSEDITRMWMKSDKGTVTITSIDKKGVKGSYDLTLNEICIMCEADSVVHVTGEFDINFEP